MPTTSHASSSILRYSHLLLAILLIGVFNSCTPKEEKEHGRFIINEIMPSNHTGLMAQDGELYDWIEIKNISNETTNLAEYSLLIEKSADKKDKKGKKKGKKSKDNAKNNDSIAISDSPNGETQEESKDDDGKKVKTKQWQFPSVDVKPGECIIVFASKKENKNDSSELHASFKLPSGGGKLQLLHGDNVISEVSFGEMENDQCYRRIVDNDTIFEACYEPTPGFENNAQGYEQYNTLIEQQRHGPLRMWELHSKGRKDGKAWVEIKNVSDTSVTLKDYFLTTSKKDMKQWAFPEVELKPGAVYVVNSPKDEFKIRTTKAVMLTKDGIFVDGMCGNAAPFGTSVGRVKGKDGFFFFSSPTRGAENTTPHFRHIAKRPEFVTKPGVYSKDQSLKITIDTHGKTVRYTTDGSMPNHNSPVFNDSLEINETTIVRAYCDGDSTTMQSTIATSTYIFTENHHTLTVVNITVDSADLYDKTRGIYVEGPGASKEFPHQGANYWKPMWKKAHVEIFDSIQGLSEDCELAIFGGFSRALPKKSFKIRFRDTQGPNSVTYDLFGNGNPQKHKNFVLRSGSQDVTGVMVRDEFFTSLMKSESPSLLVQAYRPVALYINGDYFGLYYIREKIDKRFVARHLNVKDDNISIIMSGLYCDEGTKKNYNELTAYIRSHDLSKPEYYNHVKEWVDLPSLIDFKLGEIYSSNTDVGNMRMVQDANGEKKWYTVYYDLDATWVANKPSSYYLRAGSNNVERAVNLIISNLLKNSEFRTLFLEHLSTHMHKTFTTQNTTAVFDNIISTIKPEMELNCKRWPQLMSYKKWESRVDDFREKFAYRNKKMLNDLRKELAVTPQEDKKYFSGLGF